MIGRKVKRKTFASKIFKNPSFGLSLSDHSIKVAQVGKKKKRFFIKKVDDHPLNRRVLKQGLIENEKEFEKALREIKKRHRMSFINFSFPSEQTFFLRVKIPLTKNRKEMEKNILFHLKENLPFEEEDIIFSYNLNSHLKNENYNEALVSAFSKKILENYKRNLQNGGLRPISIEPEGESLVKVIPKEEHKNILILIDYGKTKTTISLIKGGLLYGMKTFNFPGKSSLRDKINETVISWSKETGYPIEKILLFGDASGTKGLPEYLSRNLRVPVERAVVKLNFNPNEDRIPEVGPEELRAHASAIGSALR